MYQSIKFFRVLSLAAILIGAAGSAASAPVRAAPADTPPVQVIVSLRDQAELSTAALERQPNRAARQAAVINTLRNKAAATQPAVIQRLRQLQASGGVKNFQPLWMINALAVTGSEEAIAELSRLPEVERVTEDYALKLADSSVNPDSQDFTWATTSLRKIHAAPVWIAGYTGEGIVVANVDTGVSLENPDLAARWRGGDNSWFDVHAQHLLPADASGGDTGHGTNTMSIMLGSNIGVAPGAKWIAAKLFNDAGGATVSNAIQAYQWVLDPDGDPATADGAHVVNSSWTFGATGCIEFEDLHLVLQTMLAADVLPVFAGGNLGNYGWTSDTSPGNYIEAFAVGSIDADDTRSFFSSQGPNSCRPDTTFPDLVAPGHTVAVQDPYGFYTTNSGTSFSAPHVAGALALLLDAFPDLTAEQQRQALLSSAYDLGEPGPDNNFGAGRLDVLRAYRWLGGEGPYQYILMPIYSDSQP